MLYKKNQEKALADATFRAPTSEYRATPFWAWNCKMTGPMLEEHIDYLKELGFGGFHMHSRSGMDNEYLSDEFMQLVRTCTDKAKRENMLAWLYDEDRWPSGAAGGLVTKTPRYRARILVFAPANKIKTARDSENAKLEGKLLYDASAELPKAEAIEKGTPYYVATFDITLDSEGKLGEYKRIPRSARAKGEKWVAFCATERMSDWYNGYCYLDTLSAEAVKKFIEITHERYKECVGDEFDKTVPAIFTDEPQFARTGTLNLPTDKALCTVPWTHDIEKSYRRAYGEDIVATLPELFWDLPGDAVSVARYRYHDHSCERFTNAFAKECGKWCDKNGLPLTGHMMQEQSLASQTGSVGEAMRAYKYFGYPGIDMLCNHVELNTAKQAQSAVHQYGKEAMLSELYGVTNWDFDFRGHKFQGDWQAALGVTIRVPHLSWVSMKGDAKRDYPATFNYQTPWYREYPYVEDHFARLNTALTRGVPDVRIGVIHPIESYWLHWGPVETTYEKRKLLDERFEHFIEWMLFSELDFDYISESMLPDACRKPKNPLPVGKMKYNVVVVPGLETMRSTTLEILKKFKEDGGRVVFVGDIPKYVDCRKTDEVKEFAASCESVSFERGAVVDALKSERLVEIRDGAGAYTDNYIYNMRIDGRCKWLFVANARFGASGIDNFRAQPCIDVPVKRTLRFKLRGEFEPTLYDTITGEIKEISYTAKNGETCFNLVAFSHDSFLFKLTPTKSRTVTVAESPKKLVGMTDIKERVAYKREEPNVLLLDLAEWKFDDEAEYRPTEEMRRLDAKMRAAAGIERKSGKQPWCLPEEHPEHTSVRRFTFNSETEIVGAEFATEDMDDAIIFFDGQLVEKNKTGFFTDKSIEKIALPVIGVGKHTLEITLPLAPRTYNENCFLLGEFNVRLEGIEATLTAPTDKIGFGSITNQGMPFYGGSITYSFGVNVPEGANAMDINATLWRGPLLSVKIDGEVVGKIVYQPYCISVDNVTPGEHTVEITVFGNRHNSFGAVHNCNRGYTWFGESAWKTIGAEFSYEYNLKEFGVLRSPEFNFFKK